MQKVAFGAYTDISSESDDEIFVIREQMIYIQATHKRF